MKKISIVVACYNEEATLPLFYQETELVKKESFDKDTEFEYIFIDDGSTDNTLNIIKAIREKNPLVRYISFSRNFGKEAAMLAGLEAATGNYIALMDADLQDPPRLLKTMINTIKEENFDIAAARRKNRIGEPPVRSFFARRFYKIINRLSAFDIADGARDYRVMTRQVADSVLSLKEYNRFTKGLFGFVGFHTKWIEYENTKRSAGKTKWSFGKLFQYAIEGITAFSTLPLVIAGYVGLFFCIISFLSIAYIIARTLFLGRIFSASFTFLCVIVFFAGVQLFFTGIMGQYLAKTYLEVKNRPVYIIKEKS